MISAATASPLPGRRSAARDNDLLGHSMLTTRNSHGQFAVRTGFQRLEEFLGHDRLRVALALNGKFIQVHRIGHIDSDNEFDIDRCQIVIGVGEFGISSPARRCPRRRLSPPRSAPPRSRHTSAWRHSRRFKADGDMHKASGKARKCVCRSHSRPMIGDFEVKVRPWT